MRRDLWITIIGISIAGLALIWVLSSGGFDPETEDSSQEEPKLVPAG